MSAPVEKSLLTRRNFLRGSAFGLGAIVLCDLIRQAQKIGLIRAKVAMGQSDEEIKKVYLPMVFEQMVDEDDARFAVEAWPGSITDVFLQRVQELDVSQIRYAALEWNLGEKERGVYDEEYLTKIKNDLNKLHAIGVNVWLDVKGSPVFARRDEEYTCSGIKPEEYDRFAQFIKKILIECPWITHVELRNEPDTVKGTTPEDYYGCETDADIPQEYYQAGMRYGEMLKVVYPVIKSVNPNIKVVAGALMFDRMDAGGEFARGMIEVAKDDSNKPCYDLISFHDYAGLYAYQDEFGHVIFLPYKLDPKKLKELHYIKAASTISLSNEDINYLPNGGLEWKIEALNVKLATSQIQGVEIAHGEGGLVCYEWPEVCGNWYEKIKAGFIFREMIKIISLGGSCYTVYALRDPGYRQSGLLNDDANLTPRPAFRAFQFLVKLMKGEEYQQAKFIEKVLDESLGIEVYVFKKDDRELRIYWRNDDNKKVKIPVPKNTIKAYHFVEGEIEEFIPENIPEKEIQVGWFPVIVEIDK